MYWEPYRKTVACFEQLELGPSPAGCSSKSHHRFDSDRVEFLPSSPCCNLRRHHRFGSAQVESLPSSPCYNRHMRHRFEASRSGALPSLAGCRSMMRHRSGLVPTDSLRPVVGRWQRDVVQDSNKSVAPGPAPERSNCACGPTIWRVMATAQSSSPNGLAPELTAEGGGLPGDGVIVGRCCSCCVNACGT